MGIICGKEKKTVVPTNEAAPAAATKVEQMPKIVFVLGGPGSGKGTICERIVNDFKFTHLSAGDLLREEVAERPESELAQAIQQHMKEGSLVPATVIVPLIRNKVNSLKATAVGFLIDGFPRELTQADVFEKEIAEPTHILFCQCSEETMKQRLLKRGETSGRVDDNEETIKKRFDTFTTQSVPVVEHYQKKDLVTTIEANKSKEEAYAQAKAAIEKIL